MKVIGQEFTTQTINHLQATANKEPGISRSELSRRLCRWLDWRTTDGRLQVGSGRKALSRLDQLGIIRLPKATTGFAFQGKPSAPEMVYKVPEVKGALPDLGRIEIVPVGDRRSQLARLYKYLMNRYHYLGNAKLSGAQIRYLIHSEHAGYIGALAFSSGTFALAARDRFIGWNESARRENLQRVITNNRFVIAPQIQVKNLASHVLSKALARLLEDWQERYNVAPLLVETFVDPTRFDATCYRASNWQYVGETAGRRDGVKKSIYLYKLQTDWRALLCRESEKILGSQPGTGQAAHWMETEFSRLRVYDERLKQRLYMIAHDFYNQTQASIPQACGSRARTVGAYRFFNNPKITMDVILTPHIESTIDRIRDHDVVLAPQDTSTLNYTHHPATEGMGPINNQDDTLVGLMLHPTLAFTESGTPLGILDAQCWARDPKKAGIAKQRKQRPIEEKESMKWINSYRKVNQIQKLCPQTTLVSIGDREADIYELFMEATQHTDSAKLLVRADRGRQRKLIDGQVFWANMEQAPVRDSIVLHLPKRGNHKARDAVLSLRFSEVTLNPPVHSDHPPLKVNAIYLREEAAPGKADIEAIEWMLLTTAQVKTVEEARCCVQWYTKRWGIEVYFRVLKTGCRIKDRQLGTADGLMACLGVDLVIAWRVFHLAMLAREVPEQACTVFFNEVEWQALCCYHDKVAEPPEAPPTMLSAVKMLATMGGHQGRKADGMPGNECLWRGLQRLDIAVDMYVVFKRKELPKIRQSYPYALQATKTGTLH